VKADPNARYFHFLRTDRKLRYADDDRVIEPGMTVKATGRLALCENGCHASPRAIDALKYAPGPIVCRVALGGAILTGDDKVCARTRTVLWMADAEKTLRLFAIWCWERGLVRERAAGREPDPRSWAAIEEARRYVEGWSSREALSAARAAAWAARTESYQKWRAAAYATAAAAAAAAGAAAAAATDAAAYAAASAAAYAAAYAASDADAYAAADAAAADARTRDRVLADYAEWVVEILIDLNAPGCQWLDLVPKEAA
jgi:hypothetical protein